MDAGQIADYLVSAGSAMGGFALVFLGITIAGFDAYEKEQRSAVQTRFAKRGRLTLAGFVASLLAVVAGFITQWTCPTTFAYIGVGLLALGIVLILTAAYAAVLDLHK